MAQKPIENLDFSGLFKLDTLSLHRVSSHSYYELGLKKFIALSSNGELIFIYINSRSGIRSHVLEKSYFWDFVDNPVNCLCFEPSGTWLVVVSEQKVLLVPFLPLFAPETTFDCKWPITGVTVLPLLNVVNPTAVVWWLTKESNNYLIIGSKNGNIYFYAIDTQNIVGECKVADEISNLQMCFDDSLDLLTLLITCNRLQQWKLVLEHRSFGYNWLHQMQNADSRTGNFFNYIKQLSKDKITLFTQQSTSTDNSKPQTVEYILKPTEYLPSYRKRSNSWAVTAQYVNGRHFLTAFNLNDGLLSIESPDQDVPARTFQPTMTKDAVYLQGLWSQRLIYLIRDNQLEIHSATFAVIQGTTSKENTLLWSVNLLGCPMFAYLMSEREPPAAAAGCWKEPTFLCDLHLPRFALEPCLVITDMGAFMLTSISSPAEWVVGGIMRGGAGVELAARALAAPSPPLLRAAADMLLARGKITPAQYLYSLSQYPTDGWLARLGVFGRLQELSMFSLPAGSTVVLGNVAVTIKLLAILIKIANNREEKFETNTKFTNLTAVELEELSSMTAALGLWDLLPTFTMYRGHPHLLLRALKHRKSICRGAFDCLLRERNVVTMLLVEDSKWFYDFIQESCGLFDISLLKRLCLWLCPLQQQFNPVLRDLKLGIKTSYTSSLEVLISTFIRAAGELESRCPNPEMLLEVPPVTNTWIYSFVPRREVSCGLAHWAVCEDGNARIIGANSTIDSELIGRVVSVACGRHHTLLLTENGVYACGDNSYGQLGVGLAWAGAVGDLASPSGALLRVNTEWASPLVAVAAGHYHSAAVDCGGRLFVWGWGVHGQLGLGKIDDEWTPQLVTKLQGRKVCQVSLGACHSVALCGGGGVWAWGAGAWGQVGAGPGPRARDKRSVPVRVRLPEPATAVAAGYFHNLALCESGAVFVWGASPQCVRAAHARSSAAATSTATGAERGDPAPHLAPVRLDLTNLLAPAYKIAAGWHHSCIIDKAGFLYTWGLNFDGQIGSGDRKQVAIPTQAKFNLDIPAESQSKSCSDHKEVNKVDVAGKPATRAVVGCGGDFTVFVDDDGRIFIAGNTHQESPKEVTAKTANRVIMMKTTKRVIKIPTHLSNNKFLFQPIDRIDIMFPFDVNALHRTTIESIQNPLESISDYKRQTWSDELLISLLPWIKPENLDGNNNMKKKLAFHNRNYAECLRLSLEDIRNTESNREFYLTHSNEAPEQLRQKDDLKIAISNVISKRIKEISLSTLNDKPYPPINTNMYKTLPCTCDEITYISKENYIIQQSNKESDLSINAANVVDKCIAMFPTDPQLWETCFKISKDFFLKNKLSVPELEKVLRKYMEINASTMAHAVMYSNDCVQYNKMLSPNFQLSLCSKIMDTWT